MAVVCVAQSLTTFHNSKIHKRVSQNVLSISETCNISLN